MQSSEQEPTFPSLGSDATAVSRNAASGADEGGYRVQPKTSADALKRASFQPSTAPATPRSAGFLSPRSAQRGDSHGQLLDQQVTAEPEHVQFASYTDPKRAPTLDQPPLAATRRKDKDAWIPWPLRRFFWVPLILFLIAGAVALEVLLYYSNKNLGWPAGDTERERQVLHYAYTLPPVIIASAVVAMWAWTDAEIKKMQPYVDLVHGDSPPHKSLLLDYTRYNNVFVWTRAASNRHYLVALASLMVLLTLSFQPLAAALLVVRQTWMQEPDFAMKNHQALGLNADLRLSDLSYYLTSAGFASAAVMYDLQPPAFVRAPYTIGRFDLPVHVAKNGTAFVNTTAVKSEPNCVNVDVTMVRNEPAGTGWVNSFIHDRCNFTFPVNVTSRNLFGVNVPACEGMSDSPFSPVVFWYFTYIPSANASATFCRPSISFWEVNVGVDIATGNITKISETQPFTSVSPFSRFSGNVTGPPTNGRAQNGIRFDLETTDPFVIARANATQLQLPAAVYQAANKDTPLGFSESFDKVTLTNLTTEIYATYLSLIARDVYFLPFPEGEQEDITIQVKTFRNRVWLSDVAVHLLATAMIILAFFATIVHLFHKADRRDLTLKHEPGTIASAVSIGAQTGVGEVLAGRTGEKELKEALRNKKFRIDPTTMKIVMEGEYGYEDAKSPVYRRQSMIEQLMYGPSRKSSRAAMRTVSEGSVPPSPRTLNTGGIGGEKPQRTPTLPVESPSRTGTLQVPPTSPLAASGSPEKKTD